MFFGSFILCQALFLLPVFAFAGPVDVCSFFDSHFYGLSWESGWGGCAKFHVKSGGCKKRKGWFTYPGDLVSVWMPELLVEITRHEGESIFATGVEGLSLKQHLAVAFSYQKAASIEALPAPLKPFASLASGLKKDGVESSGSTGALHTWHARILPIPFAQVVGEFSPFGGINGSSYPVLFDGISEFHPDPWLTGWSDLPIALTMNALLLSKGLEHPCFSTEGQIAGELFSRGLAVAKSAAGALGGLPDVPGNIGDRPNLPKELLIRNFLPGSDASNPSKFCMGSLGPLLPRMGASIGGDRARSALIAALKFLSLNADSIGNGRSRMQGDDFFQVVYPRTTVPKCFLPGSQTERVDAKAVPFGRAAPTSEWRNPLQVRSDHTYVFALWRRRMSCQEPFSQAVWKATFQGHLRAKKAACTAWRRAKGGL